MMTNPRYLFSWILVLAVPVIISSCKSSKPATKSPNSNSIGSYKDDLSGFRPVYTVAETKVIESKSNGAEPVESKPASKGRPGGDITQKLNTVLDTIAVTNKSIRYAQGYRVQIYSGTSSAEANRARDRSYALFPDITPHIVYIQPNFRVKVGDFIDRLEAQRVYVALQAEFPNALIVPERIEIR